MRKINFQILILILISLSFPIAAQTPDFNGLKVMINPGHGGHDSDDRGMPNGFWESEGNLTKGMWLRDLLEARGCEVIMSRVLNRTEDDLPLSQIAAIANQNEVDLFLSIHSNAGNQTSNYVLTIFNGKTEQPAIPEAKEWARILWEQLVTNRATYWTSEDPHYIGDLTLNPDWSFGYGVLYPLTVPGIISEGSFHDYKPEMDRLLNLEYRKQEAWNMLYAMVTYFQLDGIEPHGIISGIIRDSLLTKDNYSIAGSPDKYHNINGARVELLETGDFYLVDSVNTGFYMFDSLAPGSYHLVFSAQDYFNDTVEVEVTAHLFSYVNHWLEADKTMPPKLLSYSPGEAPATPCFDPVRITFNMNMDSASVAGAFSIDPEIPGSFSWDKKYLNVTFQPDIPYETETLYTIVLDTTAKHQWGVGLDTSLIFTFTTGDRNRYKLENTFPSDQQEEVSPYLQFRVIFDAPLNNSSLIDAVFIVAEDGSILSTKGAEILTAGGKGHYYFSPESNLQFSTGYTLILAGSIQDEDHIPLVDTQRVHFQTMEDPGTITILDELDDPGLWTIDLTGSQGIDQSSFLYMWKKEYLSGEASILLRYNFLTPEAILVLKPIEPILLETRLTRAGMWIWGDMCKNRLLLGFDNGTEVDLTGVDFAGWDYRLAEIPEGATALDFIKLIREHNGSETGDLYFDMLHQPGTTVSVNSITMDGIRVYPNPVVGTSIHLTGLPGNTTGYAIYSITGQRLQQGRIGPNQATIDLEERVAGNHAFILHLNMGSVTCKTLLLKH